MLSCASCPSRSLGCVGCDQGLGGLGWGYGVSAAAAAARNAAAAAPSVPASAGTPWYQSILSTLSTVAQSGADIAKVAVPAYVGVRQMKAQMKALRQSGVGLNPRYQALLQNLGEPLKAIPGTQDLLSTLSPIFGPKQSGIRQLPVGPWDGDLIDRRYMTQQAYAGPPMPTAPAPTAKPQKDTMDKAMPWMIGGGLALAAGLLIFLVVKK